MALTDCLVCLDSNLNDSLKNPLGSASASSRHKTNFSNQLFIDTYGSQTG